MNEKVKNILLAMQTYLNDNMDDFYIGKCLINTTSDNKSAISLNLSCQGLTQIDSVTNYWDANMKLAIDGILKNINITLFDEICATICASLVSWCKTRYWLRTGIQYTSEGIESNEDEDDIYRYSVTFTIRLNL